MREPSPRHHLLPIQHPLIQKREKNWKNEIQMPRFLTDQHLGRFESNIRIIVRQQQHQLLFGFL